MVFIHDSVLISPYDNMAIDCPALTTPTRTNYRLPKHSWVSLESSKTSHRKAE